MAHLELCPIEHMLSVQYCFGSVLLDDMNMSMTSCLCRSVVPVGQMELLPGCVGIPEDAVTGSAVGYMALNGAALESLEVSVLLVSNRTYQIWWFTSHSGQARPSGQTTFWSRQYYSGILCNALWLECMEHLTTCPF